jgi:hypothetical protein
MSFPDHLTWTYRRDLCEQLARYLADHEPESPNSSPPFPPTLRELAGELLILLSAGACAHYLVDLLRRPEEDPWLHAASMDHLLRGNEILSPDDFAELVRTEWEQRPEVLFLCRSEAHVERVRSWIRELTLDQREALLFQLVGQCWFPRAWGWPHWAVGKGQPHAVIDVLYQQWADEDHYLPGPLKTDEAEQFSTVSVALALAPRPLAIEVLAQAALDVPVQWGWESWLQTFIHYPQWVPLLLQLQKPALSDFPFANLRNLSFNGSDIASVVCEIVAHFGADEVMRYLEAGIRSYARDPSADRIHLNAASTILSALPGSEADELLASLLGCSDLSGNVREEVRRIAWERVLALNWRSGVEQVTRCRDQPNLDRKCLAEVLYRVGTQPTPTDRELLWWSTAQEAHPEYAFAGIVGLETLGEESPEWRSRLAELTESAHGPVRLLACDALVRRGEADYLAPLEVAARTFRTAADDWTHDREQGLALRLLGELDAPKYLGLLQAVALQELSEEDNGSPEQEAVFALAQLATPEAITTLLRSYLTASDYVRRVLRRYIPAAVARLEGEDVSITNWIGLWRYSGIPP